jgi:hypothetical protein
VRKKPYCCRVSRNGLDKQLLELFETRFTHFDSPSALPPPTDFSGHYENALIVCYD